MKTQIQKTTNRGISLTQISQQRTKNFYERMVSAINSGNVLSVIARDNRSIAIMRISLMVRKLMKYIITNRTIATDEDVKDLANVILDEFYFLTIEEIGLSFRRAVLGKCGEIYQLDPSTILKIINDYLRCDQRKHYERKHRSADQSDQVDKQTMDIQRGYERLRRTKTVRQSSRSLRNIIWNIPGYEQFKRDYERKKKQEVASPIDAMGYGEAKHTAFYVVIAR